MPRMQPRRNPRTPPRSLLPTLIPRRLENRSIHDTSTISTYTVSALVLASLKRYLSNSRTFGRVDDTLDHALAVPFKMMVAGGRYRRERARTLIRDLEADPGAVYQKTKVGRRRLSDYLATDPATRPFKEVVERLAASGALSTQLRLPEHIADHPFRKTVVAGISEIACYDPEELIVYGPFGMADWSGDEIYFTVFASVYTEKETLFTNSAVSVVTENVGATTSYPVLEPSEARLPVYFDCLQPGSAPYPSVNLFYGISLWEHEWSDSDRREAAGKAAEKAFEIVGDLVTFNWGELLLDLVGFVFNLAVALDNDDPLGTVEYQILGLEQWPDGMYPRSATIAGTSGGNYYNYRVDSYVSIYDINA